MRALGWRVWRRRARRDHAIASLDLLMRANAHRGGWLAGIGRACLILGILFGVHLSLNIG